jgi:hypothetical protein
LADEMPLRPVSVPVALSARWGVDSKQIDGKNGLKDHMFMEM